MIFVQDRHVNMSIRPISWGGILDIGIRFVAFILCFSTIYDKFRSRSTCQHVDLFNLLFKIISFSFLLGTLTGLRLPHFSSLSQERLRLRLASVSVLSLTQTFCSSLRIYISRLAQAIWLVSHQPRSTLDLPFTGFGTSWQGNWRSWWSRRKLDGRFSGISRTRLIYFHYSFRNF